MKKPQRSSAPASNVPIGVLADRAAEALRQERFKEATELFKLAVRQDPRPDWKASLADAYTGRARAMAAKKMFKEAAMVLENTIAADGSVREPWLYVKCLLLDGQQAKAAAYLLRSFGSVPPSPERGAFEDLAAALLVAVDQLPEVPRGAQSETARWRELAVASREALAAWVNGAAAAEMDAHLNRISMRSGFRPVRLLLKCLTAVPRDDDRTRQLLDSIQPDSAFYPFRQAVEAAVFGERVLDAYGWEQLTSAQQAFVAETRGLPDAASQFLARSAEAARGGPGTLFNYLMKQADLPQAEVRSACLNLLPRIPERLPQFEKTFGRLPDLERHRVKALAAEAGNDWGMAEQSWLAAAAALADAGADRQAMLSQGVIYRHLARLADKYSEIEGEGFTDDPVIFYLERCRTVDPEHIPTLLALIGRYRKEARQKDWHRLVDEAIQRFPDDSQVLLQATESAVARKAYKRAAGFARRLLKIDAINPGVRRQMIELQIAHARKQMRSKRPDLAAKELSAAAEWERSDSPSALLRIARGLVGLQTDAKAQGEAWLREGVELAGGGVAGWFQALLEAELMNATGGAAGLLRQELVRARETPPTKQAVMAIVAAVGRPEAAENKRAVAGLLLGMRDWLLRAAAFDWPDAEFQALAETLARFDLFDLLQGYARAARQRDSANPAWRFHEIVARTKGKAERLSMAETDDLFEMVEAAAERQDFTVAKRIERFLDGNGGTQGGKGRAGHGLPDTISDDEIVALLSMMMESMPKGAADDVRDLVQALGRQAAVAELFEQFQGSPLGRGIPERVLRHLCEAIVAKVTDGTRSRPRRRTRRSQFFDA